MNSERFAGVITKLPTELTLNFKGQKRKLDNYRCDIFSQCASARDEVWLFLT